MEIHPWRCIQVPQIQVIICSCPWIWHSAIHSVSIFYYYLALHFHCTFFSLFSFCVFFYFSFTDCYCSICSRLFSTVFIFILALVGVFYPYNRGALFTALVVIYALTSGIAGYTATSFYCQLEGTNWVYANTVSSSWIHHICLID